MRTQNGTPFRPFCIPSWIRQTSAAVKGCVVRESCSTALSRVHGKEVTDGASKLAMRDRIGHFDLELVDAQLTAPV
jgi:hypothetical protein